MPLPAPPRPALPSRPSAPLAASGLLLCALAAIGLARAPRAPAPVREAPRAKPEPTEATDALRDGAPLDLNAAGPADLELLPRIGPTLAARIVAYRSQHGPFERVEQLTEVRGIGPRTLEGLRPHVTVASAGEGDVTGRSP